MNEVSTTLRERGLLRHALGLDRPNIKIPYRNYFAAGPGHEDYEVLQGLVAKGLMSSNIYNDTFYVTRAGAAEIEVPAHIAEHHCYE